MRWIFEFMDGLERLVDIKALMLAVLYSVGFLGHGVALKITEPQTSWADLILGPLGALALSVVALYFLWNYMRKKDEIIKTIREKQLADKEAEIQSLKTELKELRAKIN